jgi:flavin prenyltransferase
MKRVIVGISGAGGAIYGIRLLEVPRTVADIETHLVLTAAARRTITLETDLSVAQVKATADRVHKAGDVAAPISSGSFRVTSMIVAPCSIKTAAGIATSYSGNLLLRAADVMLKERRPLVLLVRETPMHIGHLRLLVGLAEMGVVIMPPVPGLLPSPVDPRRDHRTDRQPRPRPAQHRNGTGVVPPLGRARQHVARTLGLEQPRSVSDSAAG